MKRLTLLRHAKSSWEDPSLADAERPLNTRGERDAPSMGRRLRARGARPAVILSSDAKRALATAAAVAAVLELPPRAVRAERALYLASPQEVLRVIGIHGGDEPELLVVGHNPGLTDLANRLLPTLGLDNLPTAGLVALDLTADRWEGLEDGETRLAYYDYPKKPDPT